eukprot:5732344-Amphidinium_carterae.1
MWRTTNDDCIRLTPQIDSAFGIVTSRNVALLGLFTEARVLQPRICLQQTLPSHPLRCLQDIRRHKATSASKKKQKLSNFVMLAHRTESIA